MWTDDPIADFNQHEKEQRRRLVRFPVCACCGEPIQDERIFDIDGELYHEECADKEFRRWTEDYRE